ncbi:ArsA family ATPase [Actinophytocola gossypii]|uniref:ArsA family ATPase n=1 Tax=Actinophytocola gossypii TaxID=2812003 RepID=A0ABT2J2U1_9PSEU|nr:ArsA family ATPase [Actinophytocola gossypii]MCT2582182.1 ArsA family ATPase [Actinophytocola gossypii]
MLLELARGRRVLFVGGKGGVGKTSLASALALARARAGGRVLVVSTDPAHNLGHLWNITVGDEPTRLASLPGAGAEAYVDGLEVDPGRTVDRHLAAVRRTMRRLLPERLHGQADRHLALARAAPGTHESAVLERVAEAVALGDAAYDLVVFDTAPSGHTLRLMALPEQLTAWTETLLANRDRSERFRAAMRGITSTRDDPGRKSDAELRRVLLRRQDRFALLRDTVTDPTRSGFVLVLAAERLPVAETLDVHAQLTDLGVDVAALVVNRRSPADAGGLLAARRTQEDRQLEVVRDRIPGVPLLEIPLLPGEPVGVDGLGQLADLVDG